MTISGVENLFVKLRRGENALQKGYNWKNRVDPFQHLVRREVELDQIVPMRVVWNDPKAMVEWNSERRGAWDGSRRRGGGPAAERTSSND